MNGQCLRAGDVGYMNSFPDIYSPGFNMDTYNKRFHDANVIIDAKTRFVQYGEHWGGLSIKCAANGPEFYKCGDARYRVDDDCFLIFNEGKEYSSWIDADEEVSSFTFNMSPAFERQALSALRSAAAGLIEDQQNGGRIRFTERLYSYQQSFSRLISTMRLLAQDTSSNHIRIQELFFALFLEMIHLQKASNHEAYATGKLTPAARQELFARLVRARDYIHSCYDRDVSLNDIADVACLNPYYLLREFRRAFNRTPHQYLTDRRISQARRLLAAGHLAVADVCLLVGFTDQSSFGKLFRRYTGSTPTDYQKCCIPATLA